MAQTDNKYLCPKCGNQLERFHIHQHTWYTRITKYGRITKQRHKGDIHPTNLKGINCPACNFHVLDKDIISGSEYAYLKPIIDNSL